MPGSFPNIGESSLEWWLETNTQVFSSPFTGQVQTVVLPGAKWRARLSFETLSIDQQRVLAGFLAAQQGPAGTFTYSPPHAKTPQGAPGAGPFTVNGGGQTGTVLSVAGFPLSTTGVLKAGDFLSFGQELKMVRADVNSNGSGVASIGITPAIRTSPGNGATVTIPGAVGLFRLVDDQQGRAQFRQVLFSSMSLEIMEAF